MVRHSLACLSVVLLISTGTAYSSENPLFLSGDPENAVSGSLWLTVKDSSALPNTMTRDMRRLTANSELNDILQRFQVERFQQLMSFARTPALRRVHEVACQCDPLLLKAALESEVPHLVEKVSVQLQPQTLYDPADYMWYLQTTGTDWLWYLKIIQADRAWDITRGREEVKIAVVDTQFDSAHPDLATKLKPAYDPYSGVLHTAYSAQTGHWHGTAVASCAAAETADTGDNPHGQLSAVGFHTGLLAYTWHNGLAKALHASTVMGADVISISWFSSCSPDPNGYDQMVIKEILDNGTVIVASAGNGPHHCGGKNIFPFSATLDSRIIIVTGTERNDNHANGGATQSHYPEVDISAPGHGIMVAMPSQNTEWPYFGNAGGTSFATPIVAGVVGLMRSVNKCLSPAQVEAMIKSTADPVADESLFPGQVGAGRINAHRAVAAALASHTDFAINGKSSAEIRLCHSDAPRLQGCTATLPFQTGPCLADSYFVSVQLSDPWWNRYGPEISRWLDPGEIDGICDFDLGQFLDGSGLSLSPGNYYRVKLAVGPEWQETSRLVYLEPGDAVLMINGQRSGLVDVDDAGPIYLNGCASRCAKDYFVSVQLSDPWGNRYGTEFQKWLSPAETADVCHLDLKQLVQGSGISFTQGNYYRVKLAVSSPWEEDVILMHVQ